MGTLKGVGLLSQIKDFMGTSKGVGLLSQIKDFMGVLIWTLWGPKKGRYVKVLIRSS